MADSNQHIRDATPQNRLDGELQRRVVNYLVQRTVPGPPSIRVRVANGHVLLEGTVESRSVKWRCRECCRHVAGVYDVIDRLLVAPRDAANMPAAPLSGTGVFG